MLMFLKCKVHRCDILQFLVDFYYQVLLIKVLILISVVSTFCWDLHCAIQVISCIILLFCATNLCTPLPPIDTIWAMMIVWRTRGDYRTARAVLEAIIALSAIHTYYEQLLQVKQISLCLTGFTSLCLDAYVFLCPFVFHCMHVVLL